MICPKCGSENVDTQVYQENISSKTKTRTVSKYKEKGHGILWWIFVGTWWWIVDLFLWILFFVPRAMYGLFWRKKYKGISKEKSKTINKIEYRTVCVCKNCGNTWSIDKK